MKVHEEHRVHTGLAPSDMEQLRWWDNWRMMKNAKSVHTDLAPSSIEQLRVRVETQKVVGKHANHEGA